MNTTPHAAAVSAAYAIKGRYDLRTQDIIHAEYAALIEAAERVVNAIHDDERYRRNYALVNLRAELARVKGES